MPVRIRIDVNGRDQRTFWIGRIKGEAEHDWINTYVIGAGWDDLEAWNFPEVASHPELLTHFTHRYGDGLEVCVQRGLEAWNDDVR